MPQGLDRRRAVRIAVDIPATVEILGRQNVGASMDPGYEAFPVPNPTVSRRVEGVLRDLSVDGAQLAVPVAPPLLSRLSLSFVLPGYGVALAMCVVRWRRDAQAAAPDAGLEGPPAMATCGVLFEAVDLAVRRTIATLVDRAVADQESQP
ncbi:MAG: PilZ domain-containing protein [Polyangiaceae bacterium]|jgi:hypothetical protein